MGYPGAGKTYMTQYFAQKYGLAELQLDEAAFDKDWKPLDSAIVLPKIAAFMEQENWVIDGNYSYLMQEERLEAADRIVLLLLPRVSCLYRAVKRTKARRAAGYKNDLNWWFIRFVLFGSRKPETRKNYQEIIRRYGGKVTVLRSQRQIDRFLRLLETKEGR